MAQQKELELQGFVLGEWQTNCYVVSIDDGRRRPCWFIDVGFGPKAMIEYVKMNGLEPEAVVLTHGHLDHIAGLSLVRDEWPGVPILIHEAEQQFLRDPMLNLSELLGQPLRAPDATRLLKHGDEIELGGVKFQVRHTPGHSPGGIAIWQPDFEIAFVGDTLMAGTVGRVDFPTSDGPALLRSIEEQLLTLPDATQVLPGHGPATTIGRERGANVYLQSL
jgi:glyoxylase-like metal-dependent hydrolase (beta-lactamase superfamily II)